jgi:hypothetical protein
MRVFEKPAFPFRRTIGRDAAANAAPAEKTASENNDRKNARAANAAPPSRPSACGRLPGLVLARRRRALASASPDPRPAFPSAAVATRAASEIIHPLGALTMGDPIAAARPKTTLR